MHFDAIDSNVPIMYVYQVLRSTNKQGCGRLIISDWLDSDSTDLSQSWVKSDSRLITFYLIRGKLLTGGGGGVRSNVAVGWFFLCKATDNCKILTFSLRKISDSTLTQAVGIQLTQRWLKWQSAWFYSDSTHILDFHGRLDSDSTHLSQSRVKFDSRLMSRAQPCQQVGTCRS